MWKSPGWPFWNMTIVMSAATVILTAGFFSQLSAQDASMDAAFVKLAEEFLDEYPSLSPSEATALGDHRFDSLMDDISETGRNRKREFCQRWLERLAGIDVTKLSRARHVDHTLLRKRLEKDLWELDVLQEWAWNPIAYTQLTGGAIYSLMARDFAPVEQRLRHVQARLEVYPRLYSQIREVLDPKRVPRVHAETAAKQNRGLLSILDNLVKPHVDKLPAAEREQLLLTMTMVTQVVEKHQDWLNGELIPRAEGNYQLGPELYEQKLQYTLGSSLSRQDIRDRAQGELMRVRREMYTLAREVLNRRGKGLSENPDEQQLQSAIQEALELAYAEIPARDGIVPSAYESLKITTDFVREHDLISLPDDPLEIIVMPEFQRGVSVAYCDSPGPLEVGQKTFYAVAPLPEEWSDEQCTSFLREYNIRSIHNLTVHEAMPGHFVQIAYSNRYPSRLRSLLSSGTFIEGWACYTEQMMSEEGFQKEDPLMRLITLKWYLRTISNALLDQMVHFDGAGRAEGMELMTQKAFQEEREAAGKWIRAQVTSTQLSTYFVGYQEHRDIREAAEEAWGQDFSLKRYHDAVISFGSPPAAYVKALLLEEQLPK